MLSEGSGLWTVSVRNCVLKKTWRKWPLWRRGSVWSCSTDIVFISARYFIVAQGTDIYQDYGSREWNWGRRVLLTGYLKISFFILETFGLFSCWITLFNEISELCSSMRSLYSVEQVNLFTFLIFQPNPPVPPPQTQQQLHEPEATHSHGGLKALYCSSRLLYVQKRWPAKTFSVGDTEPQIDCCFLNTMSFLFFFTVQSITTTKYMLLPLQKKKMTLKMWYSPSVERLLFDLSAQFLFMVFTDAEWPPDGNQDSSELLGCSAALSGAAEPQHRISWKMFWDVHRPNFSVRSQQDFSLLLGSHL